MKRFIRVYGSGSVRHPDYDTKQYVKTFFFEDQLFWFLEHTQDFEVAVSGTTRVKGLKPTKKHELLNVF